MVKASITDDRVLLRLEEAQKLLAAKRTVRIPLKNIQAVSTEEVPARIFYGLRLPGTHVPGVIVAGTFYTRRKNFLLYARSQQVHHAAPKGPRVQQSGFPGREQGKGRRANQE